MPSVANKNFPYHVRTTQIGVMESKGAAGNSTMEQFGHHVYDPGAGVMEQTVIIPLTRRTEELLEGMYSRRAFSTDQMVNGNPSISNALINQDNLMYNVKDVTIENVLSWSVAKRLPPIDRSKFDRIQKNRSSIGSAHSVVSGSVRSSYHQQRQNGSLNNCGRRESMNNQLHLENQDSISMTKNSGVFEDYIREVPIELFTVGKNNSNQTNGLDKK